jgi:hypothetical protein
MITQDLRSVPSDLKGYYCFEYKYTSEHHEYESHYQKFEKDLHDKIGHFFENPGVSDNPVSDFIGHRNAFLDERFEREKAEMIFLMENLFKIVERNYHLCEMLLKAKTEQDYEFDEILLFDFFPFDLLLTRFINTRWELLPMTMLESVHEALETFRSLFLPIHQGWNVLRINPSSEANHNFLDLVEAVVQNKQEGMEKLSEEVLGELRKLSYTITYTPKHSKKD